MRLRSVLIGAFVFGIVAAAVKGPNGGTGAVAELRTTLGNVSAPWLLVGFVAGARTPRLPRAAALGLGVTMLALVGFYLVNAVFVELGAHAFGGNLSRELFANRVYLEVGAISGPVFGAIGAWSRRSRSVRTSIVVGVLFAAEPIVLSLLRLVPGDVPSMAVYAMELVVGFAILTVSSLWPKKWVTDEVEIG
jgi:Family of unknown function (DUF6518)